VVVVVVLLAEWGLATAVAGCFMAAFMAGAGASWDASKDERDWVALCYTLLMVVCVLFALAALFVAVLCAASGVISVW
jgi:hypothetical protein